MTERTNLPLPDYDHLPLPSLEHRIRSLPAADLRQVLDYERAHAHRLPVLMVLERRLQEVRSGAPTSDGDPLAERPETAPPAAAASKASPATSGPAMNPPSHGDPTNPAQPRSTG